MTAETPRYIPIDAPVPETYSESQPTRTSVGQLVSLRVVMAALRRRRRFWMTVAVAGLIAGMAITAVIPGKYTATATLVLAHNPNDDPTLDMTTDTALLDTTAVAQRVINRLGLHIAVNKLMGEYQGVAVSDAVLQVNMIGPTPQDAIARTNALVASFLSVRTGIFERQNRAIVQGLRDQVSSLQIQEKSLQQQIHASGGASSSPLAPVFEQDLTEVTGLNRTIASDNQVLTQVVSGSQVLSSATLVVHSAKKRLLVDGASGLVAGLALGIGVVATQAIISDRIRRRDQLAAALGAPVALSVGRIRRPKTMRVLRLRHRLKRPNESVRRLALHVRSELGAVAGQKSLAVVSIDSADAAVLALAESARALAAEGEIVTIVDLSPGGLLGRVLGVREPGTHETHIAGATSPTLVIVRAEDDNELSAVPAKVGLSSLRSTETRLSTQVVLVLAVLDPAVGAGFLANWVTEAVVVATTGRSSATKVRANAEMLRVAGVTVISATLVAADRDDESLGDAHEQSDERGRPVERDLGPAILRGEP